jgi:4-hydroxyproline epimerase
VIGSAFEASYRRDGARIIPSVTGRAWITGDARLVFDPADPFRFGIPSRP